MTTKWRHCPCYWLAGMDQVLGHGHGLRRLRLGRLARLICIIHPTSWMMGCMNQTCWIHIQPVEQPVGQPVAVVWCERGIRFLSSCSSVWPGSSCSRLSACLSTSVHAVSDHPFIDVWRTRNTCHDPCFEQPVGQPVVVVRCKRAVLVFCYGRVCYGFGTSCQSPAQLPQYHSLSLSLSLSLFGQFKPRLNSHFFGPRRFLTL